jgi:light-regulated signal transduction histidine kinase (bacteriophytochrome)
MGALVDDLLNLARIGRKEVNRKVTGLDSVVAEVVSEQKREMGERDIEWRIHPLPFSDCDPALLKIVMTNLVSNAVKYSRPRERAVIEIGSVEEDGCTAIFVRDNGVGFSMKYADKLFGVFQRLHRVEDFEGTGVGLATVQRIIHKHGGRIWAAAEIDKGACFYFTLSTVSQKGPAISAEPQKEAYAAGRS